MNWVKNGGIEYVLIPSSCTLFAGTIDPNEVEFTCTNNGRDFTLAFKHVKRVQDGEKWSCSVDNPKISSAEVTIKIKGRIISLIR